MEGFKPKLGRNKWDGSLSSPQYQITYDKRGKPDHNLTASRDLRSKLLGGSAIMIELDSNLLAMPEPERESCALAFRSALQSLGLEFRHRATAPTGRSSLVEKLLKSAAQAHQVQVLVDAATWKTAAFEAALPRTGIRYYCLSAADQGTGLLDDIFQGKLLPNDLLERFELILFDVTIMGQMGIISTRKSYEELQGLIG